MSDNEDLLGDDLGDHSLADYNLGNEEEEQLLADDYEASASHNVPTSVAPAYREPVGVVPNEFPAPTLEYNQPVPCLPVETECVVPNIIVEVPNVAHRHSTYAPYEPPPYEESAVVPPPIPAAPAESPQIVPSEMTSVSNGEGRVRFLSERTGPLRTPQQRNIPDSLDKVIVPGLAPRGRNTWRHPQYRAAHPYRRQNYRGNAFTARHSYPPPHVPPRPTAAIPPQVLPESAPEMRPELAPELRPDMPPMGPEISPERPILPQEMPLMPHENRNFNQNPRFPFRPNIEEPNFVPNIRPSFERPMFYQRPAFNPRFGPPSREITPSNNLPQVTIHQPGPGMPMMPRGREPEVRMLPVQLPPNLPPGGLAGKKVLINPHFKGNFQPPIEGLPAYIPTRIQKSPPLSPTLENKFGPIKDIDDAAERFIAEQRNALARAAGRKFNRRSPQRYIENTTIEIENEFARRSDDELLRRQEEFINANRAGLRRRMRTPSPPPPRRSPSPRRARPPPAHDEESEYRRRVREQESLRERVLRAKEVRRRKNAVALQKQLQEREREPEKDVINEKPKDVKEPVEQPKELAKPTIIQTQEQQVKPDTTRKTPEREKESDKTEKETTQKQDVMDKEKEVPEKVERDRSPHRVESAEANSTCEGLTPPRETLTPPLDDDELELILGDIDGILSDEDDKPAPKKPPTDLRTKLAPKPAADQRPQRQKIVFNDDKDAKKKKEKSPVRRTVVTVNKGAADKDKSNAKIKPKIEVTTTSSVKSRQKITFDKQTEKEKEEKKSTTFVNRRVIIQRKTGKEKVLRAEKADPSRPHPGIFSRAVTAIGADVRSEPQIEFESGSDEEAGNAGKGGGVGKGGSVGNVAMVANLPPGMTDTRLCTLAGSQVQSLNLDKEDRSAKITFKTSAAAENFRRKFNDKMVSASRLTVTLR